jgi:RNA polymerase sigma-70 factor (ECF subfamily)
MKTSPEQIWKSAVEGSQNAWQELYQIFGGRVYQFFLRNTRNPELSMDKVQEVFIKVFRHQDSFKYGSLKTWIFRIAKNTLIDEWRKSGNREILSEILPDMAQAREKVEETVLASIEHEQMVALIDDCLLKLNEPERLVIGLVYLAGLSVPELAQAMDWPLGTAKTRVRSARLKLDAMLCEKNAIAKTGKVL